MYSLASNIFRVLLIIILVPSSLLSNEGLLILLFLVQFTNCSLPVARELACVAVLLLVRASCALCEELAAWGAGENFYYRVFLLLFEEDTKHFARNTNSSY